jgi:phenylalanyl-tRNA synthetase alpha chain
MELEAFVLASQYLNEVENTEIAGEEQAEQFRLKFLGTKNVLKPLFDEMRNVPNERKKEFGQLCNKVKTLAETKFQEAKNLLDRAKLNQFESIDLSAPGEAYNLGSRHPVSLVMEEMVGIFERIGFSVAEEREIEDDWHNFTALGTPEDHPARDMQDTFYLKDSNSILLRTHTSPVQVRTMLSQKPPIRIIAPGRVYRNETISARSHCQFHQIEGLYVAENVSFADLRQTLYYFAKEMFGATKIRLRPSYFPFTEPSAEMDVYLGLETERDQRLTKGTGWLEVLGCGMVDPVVLKHCGIDPEKYSGFAFGIGIERIALFKYQIDDIRLFFENDLRFLRQFGPANVF